MTNSHGIWNPLIRFCKWFLAKFGYKPVTAEEWDNQQQFIDDITEERKRQYTLISEIEASVQSLTKYQEELGVVHKKLQAENNNYKRQIEDLENKLSEQKRRNDNFRSEVEETLAFYRTVENRLSKALHSSDEFGFPSGQTFPGSICGQAKITTNIDKIDYVVVDGRGVLPEEVFDAIKNEPYVDRQYSLALSCIGQYGMFDNILKSIISNGGVEFSLGYNEENQTYELYYRVLCRVPNADRAIRFKPTNGGRYILDENNEES